MTRPRFLGLADRYGFWWGYVGVCETCSCIRSYRMYPTSKVRVLGVTGDAEVWRPYADDPQPGGRIFRISDNYGLSTMCRSCGGSAERVVKGVLLCEPGSWWPWSWRSRRIHAVTAEDYFAMKVMDETLERRNA